MRRVLVIGCSGAGKTTFTFELARLTDLPIVHIDQIYWSAGWEVREQEAYKADIMSAVSGDTWIIDGNNLSTIEMRAESAETIFWFDFPRWLCLFRIFKRVLTYYGRTRPGFADNCPERFDWEFLRWIWNFRKKERLELLAFFEGHQGQFDLITFKSPKDVRKYLQQISVPEGNR